MARRALEHARHDLARAIRRPWATLVLGVACILTPSPGTAEPGAAPSTPGEATVAPPAATDMRPGQWINVDPHTGKRIAESPRSAVANRPEFGTSHEGLVEKPAPGGGTMIDVRGRFRSAATAVVGTDGNARVDCLSPGAAAHEK